MPLAEMIDMLNYPPDGLTMPAHRGHIQLL